MAAMSSATTSKHECDSCGAECTGYTWSELAAEGWVKHFQNTVGFTMCGDCCREYDMRRAEKNARAAA